MGKFRIFVSRNNIQTMPQNKSNIFTAVTVFRFAFLLMILVLSLSAAGVSAQSSHTVAKGETLYSISRAAGVSVESIIAANPAVAAKGNVISAGDVLVIPSGKGTTAGLFGCREMYRTASKEKVDLIASRFGITAQALLRANPDIKVKGGRLPADLWICIPYPENEKAVGQKAPASAAKGNAVTAAESRAAFLLPERKSYDIALFMPFYTDGGKSVNFYRGFLYALSLIKKEGKSFNITAVNAGQSVVDINKLLSSGNTGGRDLFIVSGSEAVCNILSDYTVTHGMMMLLPFSKAFDAVTENPHVVMASQRSATLPYLYAGILPELLGKRKGIRTLVCLPADAALKRQVTYSLKQAGASLPEINVAPEETASDILRGKLQAAGGSAVIWFSGKGREDNERLYASLAKVLATSATRTCIIGPDAWKDFPYSLRSSFYDFDVTLLTQELINAYTPACQSGKNFFLDQFGHVPDAAEQSAFFRGYDIACHLFPHKTDTGAGVCLPWKMRRAVSGGGSGMENTGLRIVRFRNDKIMEISDHGK